MVTRFKLEMTIMMLGNSRLEFLTPSVNAPKVQVMVKEVVEQGIKGGWAYHLRQMLDWVQVVSKQKVPEHSKWDPVENPHEESTECFHCCRR